jgi:acyl-coenzyme A thioesterase 9
MLHFHFVQDSFASVIIPLKDDVLLQEKYVTFKGYIRLGRLLEDMDMFAGEYQMIICVL